ncbi:MAG TPA: sigma-70 family RNA polymerase sigma factor [Solirubrobacteraceae bacterium]|nr:sigma-70 family RNA polymerase sigma factor [Solirubrobacteraceae bacterium]
MAPLATVTATPGSRDRLELLYRAARDDVYAYVATMLGDRSSAEDVTALAFERAFRRWRLFNARRGSERAWLFGIARNAALDELRRRRRSAALARDAADERSSVHDDVEQILQRAVLRSALLSLTPRERELIALKFHGGLSNVDIARVLRVSESNAGTQLHRAIQKLRRTCDGLA